jgi:hypothetical protein
MSGWFAYFTLCASVGIFGVLTFLPVKPIGKGYFRTIGYIACALALFTASRVRLDMPILEPFLAPLLTVYLLSYVSPSFPRSPDGHVDYAQMGSLDKMGVSDMLFTVWLVLGIAFLTAVLSSLCVSADRTPRLARILHASGAASGFAILSVPSCFLLDQRPVHGAALVCSALVLGLATDTLLLGHWYLNVPNLSFEYLKKCSAALIAAISLRGLTTSWALLSARAEQNNDLVGGFVLNAQGFHADRTAWLMCGARAVIGIATPLILAILAWRCAKIHSNQSATGILYVVLFFVIVGEMIGAYLLGTTGLPL